MYRRRHGWWIDPYPRTFTVWVLSTVGVVSALPSLRRCACHSDFGSTVALLCDLPSSATWGVRRQEREDTGVRYVDTYASLSPHGGPVLPASDVADIDAPSVASPTWLSRNVPAGIGALPTVDLGVGADAAARVKVEVQTDFIPTPRRQRLFPRQ